MPNLFRVGNFRLAIFPNDHEPPHVHAIGPDWEIKVALGNGEEIKPRLLEIKFGDPKRPDLRKALLAVDRHASQLWSTWRELHG